MADAHPLKAVVQTFWDEVLNGGDTSSIAAVLSPAYTFNGQAQSADQVGGWITSLHEAMPDLKFTIEDLLGDHDKVAIRWTLLATSAKTGGKVTTSATNIITFVDGLAVSNWQNGGTALSPVGG